MKGQTTLFQIKQSFSIKPSKVKTGKIFCSPFSSLLLLHQIANIKYPAKPIEMSRNTDANRKLHKKKIDNKKKKAQEAELKRKNRLKEMRENRKEKSAQDQQNEAQES